MSSKGYLSEHIIAVTNWGSFPLGTPREVEHHHNYFTESQLLSSVLEGGSCAHEFCTSSLPHSALWTEKALRQKDSGVCV